ncbi:uncharacterized protein HD556DRAFT_1189716, partial [Suillus plorans]
KIGPSSFMLVIESLNRKTALSSKMGTWLIERQLTPVTQVCLHGYGEGGLSEQIRHQNLGPQA